MLGIKINTDWIAVIHRASPEILEVCKRLEAGDAETHQKFIMYKTRVYRITKDRWRLYVPGDLRYDIVSETHKALCYMN